MKTRRVTDTGVRGHLELLLLAVLSQEPGHGYALLRRLTDLVGDSFEFTEGALYPALHKLEDAGAIRSTWDESGPRRRRSYGITAAGRAELGERVARWQVVKGAVDAVIAATGSTTSPTTPSKGRSS